MILFMIFSMKILISSVKISDFLGEKSLISSMILLMIHKIFYYRVRVSTGGVETLWLGSFLMVDRNNAGRLGAGFISVCFETRWLGHFGGFYVPEPYCIHAVQVSST
jgi:uncharacterized membrane protein YGL010W